MIIGKLSEKEDIIKKAKIVFTENRNLLESLKEEKEKVLETESELRELLRDRQNDKILMQQKLKAFTDNFCN